MSVRHTLQTAPSANLPLIFITLESSQWIVFNAPPTVSVTLPNGVPVNGENFYLSVFDNGSTSAGGPSVLPAEPGTGIVSPGSPANPPIEGVDAWVPYVGPISAQGGSATFADTAGTFSLLPNQPVYLAVFQSGIAQINLSLSAPLVMGAPSTPTLEISALDQLGGTVQGVLPEPMTFTTTETAGRATLGETSITNLSQTIPVTYDGDADQFDVTATLGGVTSPLEVTTLLPPELPLGTPSPFPELLGPVVIGSDGSVWSTIGAAAFTTTI
ncbi:MAG TPA: hypothetical protein VME66_06110 [Candidatus Acidoferrales bacterium]|nr:hypothetical protein [Candidatus Acidoferrales bacterium]